MANGAGAVGRAGALLEELGVLVGKDLVPVGKGGAAVDRGVLVEVLGNGGNELVLLRKGGLACLYRSYG